MAITPISIWTDFELRPFAAEYAPLVAGWVETPHDLFWLAPGTPPPLTAQKVVDWAKKDDNPFLFRRAGHTEPVGYAELNPTPRGSSGFWIGHLIVPKTLRGQGIGYALVMHLMQRAFSISGAKRVSLVVFPENETAVHCYLKAGMVQDGVQVKSFEHITGQHKMLKMTMALRQFERKKLQLPT